MRSTGTRRVDMTRRRNAEATKRLRLKRLILFGLLGLALLSAGVTIFYSGAFLSMREWGRERLVQLAANAGFRVQNIYVEGRFNTDPDLIRGIVNVEKGDPLFAFDPETTRDMLRKASWVRDAEVRRQLPDSIYIRLIERKPLALWQRNGRVVVVDKDGVTLTNNLAPFKDLILVVGDGANRQADTLLSLLSAEPDLMQRVEAASWIGDRRWDLKLKSSLIVRLPEDDLGLALRKLARAQEEDKLLEKDIDSVDLRESDRFVVRTKPGAVQEYKASFKPGGGNI